MSNFEIVLSIHLEYFGGWTFEIQNMNVSSKSYVLLLVWHEIFCVFFSKFPRIVEKALEASILRAYKGSSSIFRTITKSWTWTLIASQKWVYRVKSSEYFCFINFVQVAKQRKQQETYAVRWERTRFQFIQCNIGSIGLRVVTSNSMIHDTLEDHSRWTSTF